MTDPSGQGADLPAGDDEEDGAQEGVAASDLFKPPSDDEYDTSVSWFDASGSEDDPLVARAQALGRGFLSRASGALAIRFGGGSDRWAGGVEPEFFAARVLRLSRLTRWVTASAFPGVQAPRILVAVPGSLSVVFGVPPGETRLHLGAEEDFPTMYGARAVTRLLEVAGDEERLLEAVRPLGKRAVVQLLTTFNESAQLHLSLDALTHDHQTAGLSPRQAEQAAETLSIVPLVVERAAVPIVGFVDRPDREELTIKFQQLKGPVLRLRFEAGLTDRVRTSWGKCVVGTMVVFEAENPSLPRAPRRARWLRSIDHIYEDADDVPRGFLPGGQPESSGG